MFHNRALKIAIEMLNALNVMASKKTGPLKI